jgi:serine/threonine protein kinase
MEFCDCSLEDKLRQAEKEKKPIPMEQVRQYAKQLFNGMAQLHAQGISHRDLKPENILLKIPGNDKNLTSPITTDSVDPLKLEVKICDLGAAKVLDKKSHYNTPYVVSRYYRAPELILGSIYYDLSIDVWAIGCILFELVTRTPMFPGDAEGVQVLEMAQIKGMPTKEEMAKFAQLCEGPVIKLFERNQDFGEVDLAKVMMSNARSAYSREEIDLVADLINKCIKWIPQDRVTCLDALKHPFFASTDF